MINEIKKYKEDLKYKEFILIPFIGPTNAGKSTIINGIIGEEILPTSLRECTKRGVLIRYAKEDENDITIRKAFLGEGKFSDKISYIKEGDLIGKGIDNVRETLKGLNNDYNKNEKDSFYCISTKIKLFDELKLSDHCKKMIYLIDLPGYGTKNIFETKIYKKIISICNAFIFVVRNSVIKENYTKEIIDSMFTQTKSQKNKLSNGLIKSCLFILNNDNKQSTGENDIDIAKNDIIDIIKGLEKENINIIFFNAKYYLNYCNNFKYFFNIKYLFNMEYDKFTTIQNMIYKNPESFNNRQNKTFKDFLCKKIMDRIKREGIGDGKITKNQQVNEHVCNEIENINSSFLKNEKDKQLIEKLISYGQDNINQITTLSKSNIEIFKKALSKQINYINKEVQDDILEIIDRVILAFDFFFSNKKEKDSKKKEEYKKTIKENNKYLLTLNDENNKYLRSIYKRLKEGITNLLEKKKKDLEKSFEAKNFDNILKEINNEILNNIKQLKQEIESYIHIFNERTNKAIYTINKIIGDSSNENIIKDNTILKEFKIYFYKKIGAEGEDLAEEIYKDIINSTQSLGNILLIKGPIKFLASSCSKYYRIMNIINIIKDEYLDRINIIFTTLYYLFKDYIDIMLHYNTLKTLSFFRIFDDRQLKIWTELHSFYEQKKKIIEQVKNDLLEK